MLLLLALACLHRPPEPPPAPAADRRLTLLEAWLVLVDGPEEPLRLVQDDTDAGRRLLGTPALPVDPADLAVQHLVGRMRATLAEAKGVGIAAPQVGVLRQVVLVQRLDREGEPVEAYLNPAITFLSADTVPGWEGCLSVPEGRGQVDRARTIRVAHDTPDGGRVEEVVEGWTARIFQHELDHLSGVLFTERTLSGRLVGDEEYKAMKEGWKAVDGYERGEAPVAAPSDEPAVPHVDPPFVADAIRRATDPGRRYTFRVQQGAEPPGFLVLEFVEADEVAATIRRAEVDLSGALREPMRESLATWAELEAHAHFPAATTTTATGWVDTPAGAFDAVFYDVDDPEAGTVSRFAFARDLPGAPVDVTVRAGDDVVYHMELMEHRPGQKSTKVPTSP